MWSIILVGLFQCCGNDATSDTPALPVAVVTDLSQDLQTGSLIFSRGDCLAVKIFSQSHYTHVGGVVVKDGEAIVYDSMNGVGVRRTPFAEYLRQQTPSSVHIVHPSTRLSDDNATLFEQHLESQLGRKYAVKHHLTGKRCDGLHCSEYMTDALMAAKTISAKNPPRVSPGSLLEGVRTDNLYVEGNKIELQIPEPPLPEKLTWYQRAWHYTTSSYTKSTVQLRRWVLCR